MIFNDHEEIAIDNIKMKLTVLSRRDGLFSKLLNEKENYILLWETYGEENEDNDYWIKIMPYSSNTLQKYLQDEIDIVLLIKDSKIERYKLTYTDEYEFNIISRKT